MGWKLRKDKLRAETTDAAQSPDDQAPLAETASHSREETTLSQFPGLPLQSSAAEDSPAFDAPFDLNSTAFAPLSSARHGVEDEALHLDRPKASTLSPDVGASDSPVFDPLSFAPAPDSDMTVNSLDNTEDDAPVFGIDSVFVPEVDEEPSGSAPLNTAFDPLPDEAADAIAMPHPGPAPIALGGDAESTLGAFVPYQPENDEPTQEALAMAPPDDDIDTDPDLEVGGMAFDPQSPSFGTFEPETPTAGEEMTDEATAPAFADEADTSPLAFEPAFETPDTLPPAVPIDTDTDPNAPYMDREALAAGLVTMEASSGLPRVAPFVIPGPGNPALGDEETGQHSLVLRIGTLSATYPLVKPVTTIGRPDSETNTYPDIEVDMDDGVSRRHAEVRQEDGKIYLVDMGSTNGTILNGELLTADRPMPLMRGDRIRIGERVEIVLE